MRTKESLIEQLPKELAEVFEEFLMPVDLDISLKQVILSPENYEAYMRLIKETQFKKELRRYDLDPINRVILYGASGTGKTFSTKAIANHLGYTMLYIDIGQALSSGNIAKNIKDIFTLAETLKNCLIFLDECDSIAWSREENSGPEASVLRRATNTIFQCLDQMSCDNLFFAATNMETKIDAAFVRRFQLKMQFKTPDMNLKESVAHFISPKFSLIDDVDKNVYATISKRASQNSRLSYYEIEEVTNRCMKDAILDGSTDVSMQSVMKELARSMGVRLGIIDKDREITETQAFDV